MAVFCDYYFKIWILTRITRKLEILEENLFLFLDFFNYFWVFSIVVYVSYLPKMVGITFLSSLQFLQIVLRNLYNLCR